MNTKADRFSAEVRERTQMDRDESRLELPIKPLSTPWQS